MPGLGPGIWAAENAGAIWANVQAQAWWAEYKAAAEIEDIRQQISDGTYEIPAEGSSG